MINYLVQTNSFNPNVSIFTMDLILQDLATLSDLDLKEINLSRFTLGYQLLKENPVFVENQHVLLSVRKISLKLQQVFESCESV